MIATLPLSLRTALAALLLLPTASFAAGYTLTPSTLPAFPSTAVGATATAQTITVTNNGGSTLTNFAVSSSSTTLFPVTSTCTATLAANATCTASVRFSPTAIATSTATLTFRASRIANQTVALSGTGIAGGVISVTPTALAFGNHTTNTSATQTFTLTNASTNGGRLSSVAFTAPTGFTVSGCTGTLAAGASCTATVTFRPTAATSYGGATPNLKITASFASNSGQNFVALSGTGVAPAPVATPSVTSLAFPQTALNVTATSTFTIRNTGTAALTGVTFTAPNSVFTVSGCTGSIAANSTCTVTVRFKPTAATTYSGNLLINSNAPQVSVSLSGTGFVLTPVLTIVTPIPPGPIVFGGTCTASIAPPPVTVIAQNSGTGPLTFTSVVKTGAAFTITNACPASTATLAAAGVCGITVNYVGKSASAQTGTLTINTNGGNATFNLSGTCANPASP